MDEYTNTDLPYWEFEEDDEDDDDSIFSSEDDEVDLAMYNQLVEEESSHSRRRSGAAQRKIRQRDFPMGHRRIKDDYFVTNPVFNDAQFRRRFRMHRHLFRRIKEAVKNKDSYFKKKCDATGKPGLSALQKCVAAIRILAYGLPLDAVDEYVRIGESTTRKTLRHFCRAVIDVFGPTYLRKPNAADVARLLQQGEDCGFPRKLGSMDCMHWPWRNCPTSWKGQFTGRNKHPSLILEAVASHDLWIWHAYFGMPGSNNDINVLHRSDVFSDYVRGRATPVSFEVNGRTYDMGYYLADGIYPNWPAFVKTISHPMEQKTQYFASRQESECKDIECAFGVLQTRFAVIRGPAYCWDRRQLNNIMVTCIILHNMIVEYEGPNAQDTNYSNVGYLAVPYGRTQERADWIAANHKLRDPNLHSQLLHDLIEHQWNSLGSQPQ